MPYAPPTPCRVPGCSGLSYKRNGYCEEHQRERDRRESPAKRGYDRQWQKVRELVMRRDAGICGDCGQRANEVHHIIPIEEGGERLSMDNCISLCKMCHAKRHTR